MFARHLAEFGSIKENSKKFWLFCKKNRMEVMHLHAPMKRTTTVMKEDMKETMMIIVAIKKKGTMALESTTKKRVRLPASWICSIFKETCRRDWPFAVAAASFNRKKT